jgi:hypothetical protein
MQAWCVLGGAMTTLRLFASALVAAMFISPCTTSASNFTPRADQPVKLVQNTCTPAHQRRCREHHDQCVKKPGSTEYGCCISYSACLTRGFCPGLDFVDTNVTAPFYRVVFNGLSPDTAVDTSARGRRGCGFRADSPRFEGRNEGG